MDLGIYVPKECKKSIRILTSVIGMAEDVAYSMLLMTAALMDLHPEDEQVLDMVLEDCGIYQKGVS